MLKRFFVSFVCVWFACVSSVYADSNKECLGVDFLSSRPLKKADSEFYFFARARMVETAKKFGVGICLDYYGLSQKIEIMEMEWFDMMFQQIEKIGNADSSRCYTTNRRKHLKEEIKAYVISQQKGVSKIQTCLELYDSKKYKAEIERIVKKYCKECK
ncbi:hypothetical protein CQA53_06660 [Helicobacter didelphidarum]|uniref:Lysozyme inhibitor LprI N-terminal domain-containing protein n=1 Tax=Helicobacter didelphidarum TaxID=2040648 RepID=A0A3D8IJ53_9HELI|nr:hypothetical protein [Helicobacter didelphidarum]RDU65252.1 hypothetical protein CQA53_06660 [Helicobacter didelphidarum]